jgi:hypothetical protein
MTRPRKMTSAYCMTCRRQRYTDAEDHQRVAQHRIEHRRLDRRRATWRAYGNRKRSPLKNDLEGYLHELGCSGKHRGVRFNGNMKCAPIPVYRLAEDAA